MYMGWAGVSMCVCLCRGHFVNFVTVGGCRTHSFNSYNQKGNPTGLRATGNISRIWTIKNVLQTKMSVSAFLIAYLFLRFSLSLARSVLFFYCCNLVIKICVCKYIYRISSQNPAAATKNHTQHTRRMKRIKCTNGSQQMPFYCYK